MAAPQNELESSLSKLSVNPSSPSRTVSGVVKKTEKKPVADSWEDEDEADSSGAETERPLSHQQSADYPAAPPPTPVSATTSFASSREEYILPYGFGGDGASEERRGGSGERPLKTDAVAKRLIAGALGVKVPKKTEEQRAYERALKEKEMKRRNQEKDAAERAKEEAERAKVAVWSD